MLKAPEDYSIIRILSIDPGLNNTGISIITFDYHNRVILSIETFLLQVEKLSPINWIDTDTHSERALKLMRMREAFHRILVNFNPCLVVSESAFYNPKFPQAYAALIEVINTFRTCLLDYNYNIGFYTIAPTVIKTTIKANKFKGKDPIKDAVKLIPEIMDVLVDDIETLDQHSIDSIAIGYTFLKTNGA